MSSYLSETIPYTSSTLSQGNLNGVKFTLKTHQMHSSNTTPQKFQTTTITSHFSWIIVISILSD